jgi:hypothetical protein
MKYDVLKTVIINGTSFAAGSVVEIHHDKNDRLITLGYIAPKDEGTVNNRAVGVEGSDTQPKRRGRPPKEVEVVEEVAVEEAATEEATEENGG